MGVIIRRRQADYERLRSLATVNPGRLTIVRTSGTPPDTIWLKINGTTVSHLPSGGAPSTTSSSTVRIQFGERYPLEQPLVYLETPVANPHIFPNTKRICLGTAWNASETLDLFVQRIWAILAWDPEVIDPGSPANTAALDWAEKHPDRLPFERGRLRLPDVPVPEQKPKVSWLS